MVSRHVIVSGRVQGVFFRDSCRREAESYGVVGWVRNKADATVEAVFEGTESAVESMVEWCRHGPPQAEVVDVSVTEQEPEGGSGLQIR